jgi:hypothetical protein
MTVPRFLSDITKVCKRHGIEIELEDGGARQFLLNVRLPSQVTG